MNPQGTLTFTTRDEWLSARRPLITASRVAVICGASDWGSPYSEWATMCGLATREEWDEDDDRSAGAELEPFIIGRWQKKTGLAARHTPLTLTMDAEIPWLAASLDAVTSDEEPLELKTVTEFKRKAWQDEGVPLGYQIQCQIQMRVSGAQLCHLAAMFGPRVVEPFLVQRDDELIGLLIERCSAFYRLVETGMAPAPDGSDETTKALKAAFPQDSGDTVPLSDPILAAHAEREQAIKDIKEAEARKDLAENEIRAAMGSATWGAFPNGARYQWKVEPRKAYTKVVEACNPRVLRFQKAKENR